MAVEEKEPKKQSVPFDIWRASGTTEHIGGTFATEQLLDLCSIRPGQNVLDLGCGSGFTACTLAQKYGVRVTAVDLLPTSLEQTRHRASRERTAGNVTLVCADAHRLPFPPETFDAAILESVLIFCRSGEAISEVYRVLKNGGIFGNNELALVGLPPRDLDSLLQDTLGIRTYSVEGWQQAFQEAGFEEVASIPRKMSYFEQVISHMRVDGIVGYFKALVKGLSETQIRRVFINRDMLRAARQFGPHIGYHLYVGRK